jgi:hypothetical protein
VDGVEPLERIREGIGLDELERVSRLRCDVDADDVESGSSIAHRRAARPAEQIQQKRALT